MLKLIKPKDLRMLTGTQPYVTEAALNIVFVADLGKLGKKEGDDIVDSDLLLSWINTAFISQNMYLYCASANLGCVVRGSQPEAGLADEMRLRSNQRITLFQTVGVPKKD